MKNKLINNIKYNYHLYTLSGIYSIEVKPKATDNNDQIKRYVGIATDLKYHFDIIEHTLDKGIFDNNIFDSDLFEHHNYTFFKYRHMNEHTQNCDFIQELYDKDYAISFNVLYHCDLKDTDQMGIEKLLILKKLYVFTLT